MDYQIPETGTDRQNWPTRARSDTRNLLDTLYNHHPWTCVQRARAHLHINAPADFGIKDRAIYKGEDRPKTSAREPYTQQTVLETALLVTGVLLRHLRRNY